METALRSTTLTNDESKADHFADFMKEFLMESDRAAVVLGACKIDMLLAETLSKFLLPTKGPTDDLLGGDGPLSTFSARIKMCNRLGIIDDNFARLLNVFRRLRNEFAHHVGSSSLSEEPARDRVRALAQPFLKHEHFRKLQAAAGLQMARDSDDSGVLLRATLAVFYVQLVFLCAQTSPPKPATLPGVVENSAQLFWEPCNFEERGE